MAELQQNNLKLAQKQISNVRPASVQYQQPLQGITGQNNEATIDAVRKAIDIGAEVYKKMDDASVDLELKDEQARLVEHLNNQAVLRENGIGSVNPAELSPLKLKQEWGGTEGKVKFGEGQLTPFVANDELSPRAAQLIQPSIDVANSNFLRDSQISFAKELKKRGLKNLDILEEKQLSDYTTQLSSMSYSALDSPLLKNREARDNFYENSVRNTADTWSDFFENQLKKDVEVGNIGKEDAEARLFKHREKLAFSTMQAHVAFNPKRALEMMRQGNAYKVKGVGPNPNERAGWVRREAERLYYKDQKWNDEALNSAVRTGMKSPFLLDKITFVNATYKAVNNKLYPKPEAIDFFAKRFKVTPKDADLVLLKAAEGEKPMVPGQGIPDNDFVALINGMERDYLETSIYGQTRGEEEYSKAQKQGLIKLLNTKQAEELGVYKSGWDEIVLFSKSFEDESLPYLQKHSLHLINKFKKSSGLLFEASKVLDTFLNKIIFPRINEMKITPHSFIMKEIGLLEKMSKTLGYRITNEDKTAIRKQAEKRKIKLGKAYWIPEKEFETVEKIYSGRRTKEKIKEEYTDE